MTRRRVFRQGGGVSFRGILLSERASPIWARLNKVAVAFEHDDNPDGTAKIGMREWK